MCSECGPSNLVVLDLVDTFTLKSIIDKDFDRGSVKVNQKCPFPGLGLETWEIKHPFWVRIRDFKTSILFPIFNSKLQVWFSFSHLLLRNLKLILVLLSYWSLYLPVSNCKVLRRAQTQTLKQTFTWVQNWGNFGVSYPEFQTRKLLFSGLL